MRPLFCLSIVFFLLSCPSNSYAWGRGHDLIRAWALAHLPAWQKEKLTEKYWAGLGKTYNKLQDQHAGGKAPHLDKYCIPPGPRLSLHDVNSAAVSIPAMQWYLEQTMTRLASPEKFPEEGDSTDEAMKFLGVLCHWHEDPGSPSAHSSPVTEAALRILLPPTADKVNLNYTYGYGGISNVGTFSIPETDYQPRLLGSSIPEVALRLYQHQRLLEQNAAAGIIPIVQSIQYGDGSLAEKTRSRLALRNAEHITDLLYTVFCLAYDRLDEQETAGWNEQLLSEWIPDHPGGRTSHPYYVTPFLKDQALDAQRKLHPLQIGKTGYNLGFGAGTPARISYTMTSGECYEQIVCDVGLHPTAGTSGKIVFQILIDGQLLAESPELTPESEAFRLQANLPADKLFKLELVTVAVEGSEPTHNLAVWGRPTLVKQ